MEKRAHCLHLELGLQAITQIELLVSIFCPAMYKVFSLRVIHGRREGFSDVCYSASWHSFVLFLQFLRNNESASWVVDKKMSWFERSILNQVLFLWLYLVEFR